MTSVVHAHSATHADASMQPAVALLLCTYQGEEFLAEQLDSFAAQTHTNWTLWASDGGSTDDTLAILERYQAAWGADRLVILHGPTDGPTKNFMSLVHNAQIQADYYAFSDQDDIWEANKLQRAITLITHNVPHEHQATPALYCSRTRYVDAHNHELGLSQRFVRRPSFANALMQNIAGGNTMMFNQPACQLLRSVKKATDIVIHDWWVYIVVSGCGGTVFYDPYPSVRYRQHANNVIGMNSNWQARLHRIRKLFAGRFKEWNGQNIQALQQLESQLTEPNKRTLALLDQARHAWLLPRTILLLRAGIYRQTTLGNFGLAAAVLFHKL